MLPRSRLVPTACAGFLSTQALACGSGAMSGENGVSTVATSTDSASATTSEGSSHTPDSSGLTGSEETATDPFECPAAADCRYNYGGANAVFADVSLACEPTTDGCCDQWTSIEFTDGFGPGILECLFVTLRDRVPSYVHFDYLARSSAQTPIAFGVRGDYLWVFSNGQADLLQQVDGELYADRPPRQIGRVTLRPPAFFDDCIDALYSGDDCSLAVCLTDMFEPESCESETQCTDLIGDSSGDDYCE